MEDIEISNIEKEFIESFSDSEDNNEMIQNEQFKDENENENENENEDEEENNLIQNDNQIKKENNHENNEK